MAETASFGAWMRHRRRELDLTQDDLARRVGCARITIRKLEAEQLRPSKQMAELLAQHLGIPTGEQDDFIRFARAQTPGASTRSIPARHNLPSQLSSFIGRSGEMSELRALLKDHRLVTVTGAGGTGKTRLALELASACSMTSPMASGSSSWRRCPIRDSSQTLWLLP
jgi:transcriptional regulator with XRE-family HTH domain